MLNNTEKSQYDFLLYYPEIKQFVIHVALSNMEEFVLVDATNGNRISTWGFPKFSPNKKFIVSASNNYLHLGAANGIQIISSDGRILKKVWEREIENYEPYSPKWLDNNTIGVTLKPKGSEKRLGSKFALIRKVSESDWKMEY